MAKQVIVEITPAGSVKVEAVGFEGCGCSAATEQLEIVLGGAGQKKKTKKPDWYKQASGKAKNKLTF